VGSRLQAHDDKHGMLVVLFGVVIGKVNATILIHETCLLEGGDDLYACGVCSLVSLTDAPILDDVGVR
jgi:hypothetical protein